MSSVAVKVCSFCGKYVTTGEGVVFVKNDGITLWFCSSKCKKNSNKLKRDPRKLKWTKHYRKNR